MTFDSKSDPLSATLNWTAVQTLFEDSTSDVLILLDCCAAASAAENPNPKQLRGEGNCI
jgi:hypothetical protein